MSRSFFNSGTDLWLRQWRLILTGANGKTFVLKTESAGRDFRCTFQTQAASEGPTPETAIITVYNLSDATMKGLVKEFDQVVLEAGYQNGRYGIIFNGIVKQYARGHEENMTESYLRIFAAHSDITFRFAVTNQTIKDGSTGDERMKAIQQEMLLKEKQVKMGWQDQGVDEMRDETARSNMKWNILDGKMVLVEDSGYIPGQAIDLNAETGLIGHPEITDNGITVTSLLNPAVRVRGLVKLNNDSINWLGAPGGGPGVYWPSPVTMNILDMMSSNGLYIILVRTHEGDTRGNPWYTHMTCQAQVPDRATATAGIDPARAARLPGR
jgi:hypothetical protein